MIADIFNLFNLFTSLPLAIARQTKTSNIFCIQRSFRLSGILTTIIQNIPKPYCPMGAQPITIKVIQCKEYSAPEKLQNIIYYD